MCYDVEYLQLPGGKRPFKVWINKLGLKERFIVRTFIDRIARGGGKKNVRGLGDGIYEIKIKYGPGFRIYFANRGRKIILLLLGGDKGNQKRDIFLAKKYWSDYVSK